MLSIEPPAQNLKSKSSRRNLNTVDSHKAMKAVKNHRALKNKQNVFTIKSNRKVSINDRMKAQLPEGNTFDPDSPSSGHKDNKFILKSSLRSQQQSLEPLKVGNSGPLYQFEGKSHVNSKFENLNATTRAYDQHSMPYINPKLA
jgi:hypothetical protein